MLLLALLGCLTLSEQQPPGAVSAPVVITTGREFLQALQQVPWTNGSSTTLLVTANTSLRGEPFTPQPDGAQVTDGHLYINGSSSTGSRVSLDLAQFENALPAMAGNAKLYLSNVILTNM